MFDTKQDYSQVFTQRGHMYNRASKRYPLARATERRLILDRLDLRAGLTVCDAPAGGGYVAAGIAELFGDGVRVICVEPSAKFAAGIDSKFDRVVSPLEKIDLPDASVDRVVSLAGLHHLPSKLAFFREAARILKPGGVFAVGDVMTGTPAALFLNGPVDRLSETGHDGEFLAAGELTRLLATAGLRNANEEHCRYTWDFPAEQAMAAYCKDLFGLTKADETEVRREIDKHLEVTIAADGGAHMHWSLAYASATRL